MTKNDQKISSKTYVEAKDGVKEEGGGKYNKAFAERLNLLVGELKALLTCPHDFYLFERLLVRTMIMLKKERGLKNFWEEALKYHRSITQQRKDLLHQLNELRKELKLDEVCPSLIGKIPLGKVELGGMKNGLPIVVKRYLRKPVPDEFSVKWISEARDWFLSQSKHGLAGEKEQTLFTLTTMWEYYESRWYPVGQHPVATLALLECVCERINFLFQNDASFSPMTHLEEARDLRRELEMIVTNLIADLPIIKSWGEFSVESIDWKRIATTMALDIWRENPAMSRAEVTRLVYPSVKRWGVLEETVNKHLSLVDTRSSKEKKQAQKRQKA
jgi:hypothetical protein